MNTVRVRGRGLFGGFLGRYELVVSDRASGGVGSKPDETGLLNRLGQPRNSSTLIKAPFRLWAGGRKSEAENSLARLGSHLADHRQALH